MKVIVIGGGGTIGGPVADALSARHEVIRVGRNSGDYRADMTNPLTHTRQDREEPRPSPTPE